jgi:FtsP/CotA-like multicopper oxidase with cupredoxin domain
MNYFKLFQPFYIQIFVCQISLICFAQSIFANTISDTLFINRGIFTTITASQFDYLAFNNTSLFSNENHRLIVPIGDTLQLTVINNDTIVHGFAIKNTTINFILGIGISNTISFSNNFASPFIYYDPLPNHRYLGLAGMVVFTNSSHNYYWNIKEHQASWNDSITAGNSVNWNNYYPNYFTINGKSNPDINIDTAARVTGNLGDTLYIYMVNTGQSIHSIHFHGYHSEIVFSSYNDAHVGRIKDTFPVLSMESVVLKLVPNQVGEYPVHDHNLSAVSGGNLYPNGMFLTILIN